MISAGIDIGSITTKIAFVDGKKSLYTNVIHTGYDADKAWKEILDSSLKHLGLKRDDLGRIVSTGYGRKAVAIANKHITDAHWIYPGDPVLFPDMSVIADSAGEELALGGPEGVGEGFPAQIRQIERADRRPLLRLAHHTRGPCLLRIQAARFPQSTVRKI